MPLVRIDLPAGTSPEYRGAVGEVIYGAMVAVPIVLRDDRFQVIAAHAATDLATIRTTSASAAAATRS